MSKYIPKTRKQVPVEMPNQILTYFHRHNTEKIRKALGSKCTYVGHSRVEKNELVPKINVKDEKGEKDFSMLQLKGKESIHYITAKFGRKNKAITAALNGTPNDIKAEYYEQLKNDLVNAARERGLL